MKVTLLRGLFLVLLVGSLAIRYNIIHARNTLLADYDISVAISEVADMNGLIIHDNPVLPPKLLSNIVYLEFPGCHSLSFAMPFEISNDAFAKLNRVTKPGYVHRFHYFDKNWAEQNRVSMNFIWFKQNALSFIGKSNFVSVKSAFVLSTPADCLGEQVIDWSLVWDKARFKGTTQTQNATVVHAGSEPK